MASQLAVLLLLNIQSPAAAAETLAGRVVGLVDGDTVILLDLERRQHRIRIQGIDAPEKGQAFGRSARQALSALAFQRMANAACSQTDRYGRQVCKLAVDGQDVGLAQVAAGFAWVYTAYIGELSTKDRELYSQAERQARGQRKGLWSDPAAVAPWTWRHSPRSSRETHAPQLWGFGSVRAEAL